LPLHPGTGITGLVQARDGALILSSSRGMSRIEPEAIEAGAKP
jgi:hypothetical protein